MVPHTCHSFPSPPNMHALVCPTGEHPGGWQHMPGPHHHCTMDPPCGPYHAVSYANRASIDPKHEMLHRVKLSDLTRYKEGVVGSVTALCGKIWGPTFPIKKVDQLPKCPICFPVEIYQMAVAK